MQVEKFHDLPLEDVIGDRFGRYSKYIIQDRALPDARDGLKPVQRRILYSMYVEGNVHDKPYRKAAKTVGNVIGNYHPHGDTSVYEAMVRLSQTWKVRNVLVEMHGNNGSIDGDPAAAMRYTEARLSPIASELLRDIDKQTVEFVPNFDDTSEEPIVLPASFPNLLVNGSTGISAGYATEIPPHNLAEVIDAVVMRIDRPNCTVSDLMQVMSGPDFPTGGIIQGMEGIKRAYETGRGKMIIRGKAIIEDMRGGRQQIVITEIPYEINKANLVKKVDDLRIEKKLDGISEVRDETDRTGLRIVIELKKEANAEGILNYLYKSTDLQVPYNFNMVAIHNRRPKLMGLLQILDAYIAHQKEVVTNRSRFDLKKAEERQHIVAGLMKALSILDEVIATIRASKDKRDAKDNLIAAFAFTEAQAEAIVSLQLYRLTNTDITALQKEADELAKKIYELQTILGSEKKLLQVIKTDLKRVKKSYGDERRTMVERDIQEIKIDMEVMIPQEDVIVTITKEGYVKRTSWRSHNASNGKDFGMKEGDRLLARFDCNTTDTLLLFTNKGNYVYLPVYEIPDIRWKDLGQYITNIVALERDEALIEAIIVKNFEEDQRYLVFATRNGMIKKTELKQYKVQRYSRALVAVNIKGDDEVVAVKPTDGTRNIILFTHGAYALRFDEEEVTPIGVRAAGVKGINLRDGDYVVQAVCVTDDEYATVITQRGAVKKMAVKEIDLSNRAKRGHLIFKEVKTNPYYIVGVCVMREQQVLYVKHANHEIEEVATEQLKPRDRYSNGSPLVDSGSNAVLEVWLENR
ncbi:DNA topoisomerase IV subunit A [Ectobacillus antri]|jgi:topoisomerase-4 subunit A|uniref:DNA topoisomerase 4 subunit A n=1 Tax=Ectobacillus antri TaxID=2486280 RepID=A0ABT6H4F3_9BACI|nr:DNA topoisomerase IV subunit A [Ectobacillus antri]MDG4656843.1 DNA topoisomerase IV subunit A [Ectobacillus antri]MDG5754260.1 DNA topoisomerase IV subunit A [Ectobacillus antri]